MKTKWMLAGLLWVFCTAAHAVVTVENTIAAQTPGTKTVSISYDVSSDFTNVVSITLKAFDGETEVPITSLTGDVGADVATGAGKSIVWDAGADWHGQSADGLKFWVLADDGMEVTPSPAAYMVVIPAGTMAGTDPDFGAFSLSITNSLYVDEFEVTKLVWDMVYNWAVTNEYDFLNEGLAVSNNHPVTAVNWYDCIKWCNARSELEGLTPCYTVTGSTYKSGSAVPDFNPAANGYRLPTCEEWEYAARSGATTRFSMGNQITHDEANYWSSSSYSYDSSTTRGFHPAYGPDWPRTAPVGDFAPNAFGLYDTAGNVWEWCWDEYTDDGSRYLRGGSWVDGADAARCGYTNYTQFPINSMVYGGFRTVRNAGDSVAGTAVTLVDARDYTLAVVSTVGTPSPANGFYIYAWGSVVSCSVDPVVIESNTVYVAKGWTGTGSVPESGTSSTTGVVPLNETSSTIVWRWIADNDYDDLPNEFELAYYGSITGAVASADTDGDGYTTEQEFLLGSDPTNGLSHLNLVISLTTNNRVLVSCSTKVGNTYTIEYSDSLTSEWIQLATFDGTGEMVSYEDMGTSPNRYYRVQVQSSISTAFVWKPLVDSDGDQLPNEWELAYFASSEGAGASVDSDQDGYSNLHEYWLGSDPTNSASHLNFKISATANGAAMISCSTAIGRVYITEYSESLMSPNWILLSGFLGTGAVEQYEDAGSTSTRYYRMRVEYLGVVDP